MDRLSALADSAHLSPLSLSHTHSLSLFALADSAHARTVLR